MKRLKILENIRQFFTPPAHLIDFFCRPRKSTKNIRLRPDSIGTTDGQAKKNQVQIT
jgi:hypothetical protein